MKMRRSLVVILLALAATALQAKPQYRIAQEVALPGDGGWDYLAIDPDGGRLFIAHGTQVQVVDTATGKLVGSITGLAGAHGVAFAPELGQGFISDGRGNRVVVFDLKTLARIKDIPSGGENPDAILYDPASRHLFTFNGRGRNVSAIDVSHGEVIGNLPVDAKPEFAATDGKGRIYFNLEDRNSLAVIDSHKLKLLATWPLPGCEEPSGLALDAEGQRLLSVCAKRLVVTDAASGHQLSAVTIADNADAVAWDASMRLAFASCGDGKLEVVHVDEAGRARVVQSLDTARGARTMALDARSHRVFLVTANYGEVPADAPAAARERPPILPGTFRLLIAQPHALATTQKGGHEPRSGNSDGGRP